MIIVICTARQKQQLVEQDAALTSNTTIRWATTLNSDMAAAVCIDLLYDNTAERINLLNKIAPLVVINHVAGTTATLPSSFIRINAWPFFLGRPVLEAACKQTEDRAALENVLAVFHKKISWTPDAPGFISARTIALIINEAYLTLEEGVSTKAAIDTAMKLGTGYPYGPFEWATIIGVKNIYALLCCMGTDNNRYTPCQALTNEALSQ